MNLVKWLRKNNTKIMAVVVIVLMIGFIGGSSLTYILRGRGAANRTLAYYGNNAKITQYEVLEAQNEMDILKMLQANNILKALTVPFYQTPDFHALVLGELLFAEQRPSPEVISYIQQTASRYQYRVSNRQIDDLYNSRIPSYYYWYILGKEAENAGFRVSDEAARDFLSQAITTLFHGNYSQTIGNMMRSNVLSEDQILSAFAKLLAILKYSHAVCSGQDMTTEQLKHTIAWQEEGLDVEFVKFDSGKFDESVTPPAEEQMEAQLEKYRQYFPTEITDENPYGFGYKLPDRVQLEYMVLKLDDVRNIVKKPTFDDLQAYYAGHKESEFSQQVPSDPNDPNSPLETKVRPFSEVADQIEQKLLGDKVDAKAATIIQEARTLADGSLEDINDAEFDKLSTEDRKELSQSYGTVADQLRSKYEVDLYEGTTGELGAMDIENDDYLSTLYLQGYVNRLGLARVLFAVDKLGVTELGSYEPMKPRVYLSLGPVMDASGKLIAVVRVVRVIKASAPEDINQEFSTKSFTFDPNDEESQKKVYSVKENVTNDLKRLAAMDTARDKAQQFIELAAQKDQDWQSALDEFNELYVQSEPNEAVEPNAASTEQAVDANETPFELQNLSSLRRLSNENLYTLSLLTGSNPASAAIQRDQKRGALFVEKLYSLAPQDSNSTEFKPQTVEFKPDMSYYAIKSIFVSPFWKQDYEKMKAISSYTEDHIEAQSLALVQFDPVNITKRLNFRFAEEVEKSTTVEPNEPLE